MATVEIEGLLKRYPAADVPAVDSVSFSIDEGEFLVLLGPSGCGKTTTLRCLAGLETADEGRILLRGREVFDAGQRLHLAPERRNIGMIFQSYALWPHMTVRKNLEYPLKARRLKAGLAEDWAGSIAELLECSELLDRYPSQLSGGQQQRIALARGLVAKPDLILFDEPLSNLDARLRQVVRSELHLLHRSLGFTAVYVTHDQEEAFALADRIVVMRAGKIEQMGSPEDVYHRPGSEYVAGFVGMSNRLEISGNGSQLTVGDHPMNAATPRIAPTATGAPLTFRVRPEDVEVCPPGQEVRSADATTLGRLVDVSFGGRNLDMVIDLGGTRIQARVPSSASSGGLGESHRGALVEVGFRFSAGALFDRAGLLVQPDSSPARREAEDAIVRAVTPR